MTTVWLILFIVFLVLEVLTAGPLISIWFCFGSLAAMIAAGAGLKLFPQLVIFVVISVAFLILTKPFVKKFLKIKDTKTNADRILDLKGIVSEDIDNVLGKGAIKVDGKEWTARNIDNDEIILKGTEVKIIQIEGVKALVKKI